MQGQSGRVGAEFLHEILLIGAFAAAGGRTAKGCKFAYDAGRHLVGGLVGERHGQDAAMHLRLVMPVGRERAQGEASVGSALGEEQFQILPGQCECLARSRRGFVDLQHASNLRIISVNTACLQIANIELFPYKDINHKHQ